MEIGKYIKELLFIHDCVIIPGLGGFVANYRSADMNELARTISPPSKSILFNRNLIHNDGLLIDYVLQRNGLDYRQSEELVRAYADQIMKSVSNDAKFSVDEVGFFYSDSGRKLQFQDELTTNFLIESYGLSSIIFDPVEQEKEEFVPVVTYRASVRRWVYTGVAASLVAAMVLIPVKTGYVEHMNFGWLKKDIPEQVIRQDPTENAMTTDMESAIELFPLTCHIVVGSFKDFSNARKMHNQLSEKGHDPKILEASNGYYRVAIFTTKDPGMASDQLTEIRKAEGFKSAWILKE